MTDKIWQFKKDVIASFSRVREDMTAFKRSVTDWILYLDSGNRELHERMATLEREVAELRKQKIYR